jgi:endonuclease/exonuclease/phosphatase (EEP) superfamily protein YafD
MLVALQWVAVGLGIITVTGTLLSLSRSAHWSVRMWDFPRLQIAVVAVVAGAVYTRLTFRGRAVDWLFLAALLLCALWQGWKVYPYTPLARVQVRRSDHAGAAGAERACLRLLISNVRMENRQFGRLLDVVRAADPDVVLAVETDAAWADALEPLARSHPFVVRRPQENYYGLMLFSRLPLVAPRVECLVQDDIPSVHTGIELPNGVRVFLHGLHPRPPEPIRGQSSTPRDAELVAVGMAIGDAGDRPTIVAGDLNDVAWSPTSELFLRLSGLLDPRVGRGLYNSFNADNPFFRYPLDHVFHSGHFRLCELRRLPNIGSDHFPMLAELRYEPEGRPDQPPAERTAADERDAEERLDKEAEAARTGSDRPSRE